MSFNKYYEDELSYLRELGREFAHANPELAPFLADGSHDPDVERLLEGFAFLTGRVRQKIDDDLPELTHSLLSLLWPHYLRPVPSMSILEFSPVVNALTERKIISRGVEVDSVPVDGTVCRFRTCYDVELLPLHLDALELKTDARGSRLQLVFALESGVTLDKLKLDRLRLYLHGEFNVSRTMYLWLCRYLHKITVSGEASDAAGDAFELSSSALQPAGFTEDEALLPYPENAFLGYRVIQEYFALPEKFLFFDVTGLAPLAGFDSSTGRFVIDIEFSRPLADNVRLQKDNVRLFCTPIINLFAHDADPIRVDNTRTEYRVRPGGADPAHAEIYSIDRVDGWVQGSGEQRTYAGFETFEHRTDSAPSEASIYYRTRLRPAVVGKGMDTYLSFVGADEQHVLPPTETVSLQMTCSNRNLPEKLRAGDVSTATGSSPEFSTFRNITAVTQSMTPPLDQGLHWRLISGMALNYVSITSIEALRSVLSVYDFRALYDRQAERASQLKLDGLQQVRIEPVDMLDRGLPIRGLRTYIEMKESNFAGEGDMFLLASILNMFFALYASVNSFHQLVVKGTENGEVYQWPTRIGQQPLI